MPEKNKTKKIQRVDNNLSLNVDIKNNIGGKIKIIFVVLGSVSFQKPNNFANEALKVAANLGFEKTMSKKWLRVLFP